MISMAAIMAYKTHVCMYTYMCMYVHIYKQYNMHIEYMSVLWPFFSSSIDVKEIWSNYMYKKRKKKLYLMPQLFFSSFFYSTSPGRTELGCVVFLQMIY